MTEYVDEASARALDLAIGNPHIVTHAERSSRFRPGGDFILDEPETIPTVWGRGASVLWANGEGVMLTGHQGVGKTTLAQQVVLHRIGVRQGPFLGFDVEQTDRPVLYLAMDRPRQAARSFRRMVSEQHRGSLNAMLRVWRGPLPGNVLASTGYLADLIFELCPDVGTLVVDSVKDLAPGISKDEVGAALNSAWQEVIARDVELMLLHHERKAGNGEKRVHALDDVYGSTWLTSGLGSVVAIGGNPGDPTVTLHHLKQPGDPIDDLTVRHDHGTGTSTVTTGMTLVEALAGAPDGGMTAMDLARCVIGRTMDKDLKKIKRDLAALEKQGLITRIPGSRSSAGAEPDRWTRSSTAAWAEDNGL